ncbi:hypothetical protein BDW62DRAFT_201623 [Aspergillus aurantiobrunneus]
MPNEPKIDLLKAYVDEGDGDSFFRLQVDGRSIKYLTIEPGLYSVEDMRFGPALTSLLPEFPPGDWNDGLLPSVERLWHRTYVDYADIVVGNRVHTGIYEVTCPQFDRPVLAKLASEFEIGYLESEATAYEWIDGYDIGPRFLGHLTEGDRVIGFLTERITNAQHAGPGDLAACQQVLGRLHQLGIRHGDINRFNFLIRGSEAVLIDFDSAMKCDDQDALREESEASLGSLQDTSMGKGTYSSRMNSSFFRLVERICSTL